MNRFVILIIWIFSIFFSSLELTEFVVHKWRILPLYNLKIVSVIRPLPILFPLIAIIILWCLIARIALTIRRSTRFFFKEKTLLTQCRRSLIHPNYSSITGQRQSLDAIQSDHTIANYSANQSSILLLKCQTLKRRISSLSQEWKSIKICAIIVLYVLTN